MNNNVFILKLGGERGSIQLISDSSSFLYSSDETTMLDLLVGEFSEKELKHSSTVFSTFDEAVESLMARYPIFHLHPLTIYPQYHERIINIFIKYKSANTEGHQWRIDNWENFLCL